jgi:DNA-binding NtrC family response regulator
MSPKTQAMLRDLRLRQQEDQARTKLFARYDLVGDSTAMRDVFRRVIKASHFNNLPVLIEGEAGTPKRRLALAILYLDPSRVRMPFFALSCSQLSGMLANLPTRGPEGGQDVPEQWAHLLRAARGGTVYLEEISALDAQLQRVLVSVLRRWPTEVRVIATTERPVDELVWEGALNVALQARLGLFRIPLPSLRGRPEDIAALAGHLLLPSQADFESGVLERLQRLPWEGNTAQLEGVLRAALAAVGTGTTVRLADLPAWVCEVDPGAPLPRPVPHPGDYVAAEADVPGHEIDLLADEYERRVLRNLLNRQGMSEDAVRPDHEIDA